MQDKLRQELEEKLQQVKQVNYNGLEKKETWMTKGFQKHGHLPKLCSVVSTSSQEYHNEV